MAQQSVTGFMLVTPKVGAKHELLFNKLASWNTEPKVSRFIHIIEIMHVHKESLG